MDYQELIRLSTKGDKQALEDLFVLAEKLSAEQKFEEASKAFRDSAISYRISAYRNTALSESANGKVYWLNEEIKLMRLWIKTNPSGLRPLPRKIEGIETEKTILEILKNEIWPDPQFSTLVQLLEAALQKSGIEFYSPGGSSLRVILHLMNKYFGVISPYISPPDIKDEINQPATDIEYLTSFPLDVRVLLDLLADEIEKCVSTSST